MLVKPLLAGASITLAIAGCAADRAEPEAAPMAGMQQERGLRARPPSDEWRRFVARDNGIVPLARPDERDPRFLWPVEAYFFQPESICLPDERTPVADPTLPPWNGNCRLIITMTDGSVVVGSGWLMGPRLVVTAGHCVHEGAGGDFYREVLIIPGADAMDAPFGSQVSTTLRAAPRWIIDGARAHDYGAIILDRPFDAALTYRTPAVKRDDDLLTGEVFVAGYPADKPGTQWEDSEPISRVRHDQFQYMLDTYGGQSGSAVIHGGVPVGIHNYGGCPNSATRITDAVRRQLDEWLAESERPTPARRR